MNEVGILNKYRIVFQGLSDGLHGFDFDIDNRFFEGLEYSEIKKGKLKAVAFLNKKSLFMEIKFQVEGFVELECDRCLDEYNQHINYEGTLYVKFSEKGDDLAEDVICLLPTDHEIDISHYLYESINLSIPLKRVHPDDENGNTTCNPEMLRKLNKYYIHGPSEENSMDPRWNDLRKLMGNNN